MDSVGDATVEFLAQALKPIEVDIPLSWVDVRIATVWGGEGTTNARA
jgi:hypothetical protein